MPYFDSIQTVLNKVYPVGSVVTFGVSTNPATLLGVGTWTAIAGRVIVGFDSGQTEFDTLDETGGAKTHTLITSEMPSHTHTQNAHGHNVTAALAANGTKIAAASGADSNGSAVGLANTTATNQNTGGDGAHNNLQPYIVKYVWQRTA